jgi:hypothetical protein
MAESPVLYPAAYRDVDTALADPEDGEPHIVAAPDPHEAAPIMVGEPTLERGFEQAVTRE